MFIKKEIPDKAFERREKFKESRKRHKQIYRQNSELLKDPLSGLLIICLIPV